MKKLFLILLIPLLSFCGPSKEEIMLKQGIKEIKDKYPFLNECESEIAYRGWPKKTAKKVWEKIENSVKLKKDTIEIFKFSKWQGFTIGLPTGTIISMNHDDNNIKDNYVTIRGHDTYNTIVRDIDEDLYLTLRVNNVIE